MYSNISNFLYEIAYKSMPLSDWLSIAKKYNYPFRVNESFVSGFYMYMGNKKDEIKVVYDYPSAFNVGELAIKLMDRPFYDAFQKKDYNIYQVSLLRDSNWRDIYVELAGVIYIDHWNLHYSMEISQKHYNALNVLKEYGYVTDKALKNPIWHNKIWEGFYNVGIVARKPKPDGTFRYYHPYESIVFENVREGVMDYLPPEKRNPYYIENSYVAYDMIGNILGVVGPDEAYKYLKG